jgi:hypothetical protein
VNTSFRSLPPKEGGTSLHFSFGYQMLSSVFRGPHANDVTLGIRATILRMPWLQVPKRIPGLQAEGAQT